MKGLYTGKEHTQREIESKVAAKIIKDSISPAGIRLTTFEITMHRFVLAEFNTHRVFSRNSASNRAIPFERRTDEVVLTPAIPVVWAAEQSGMQGGEEIERTDAAQDIWLRARDAAVMHARQLADLGVHKSICNRLTEPFQYQTIIVTATEWIGYWAQRLPEAAQPEIREVSLRMKDLYEENIPEKVHFGEWHLPYIDQSDLDAGWPERQLRQMSVARCARVSYLNHDGKRDGVKDLDLFERLKRGGDGGWPHASPFEHVATPSRIPRAPGNFTGWYQLRHQELGV